MLEYCSGFYTKKHTLKRIMPVRSPNGQSKIRVISRSLVKLFRGHKIPIEFLRRCRAVEQTCSLRHLIVALPCFVLSLSFSERRPFSLVVFCGGSRCVVSTPSTRVMAAHGIPQYPATVAASYAFNNDTYTVGRDILLYVFVPTV